MSSHAAPPARRCDELSVAAALMRRAAALFGKGDFARAADGFAAAADATPRTLDSPDCLIRADLQLAHAAALVMHALTPGLPPAAAAAANERAYLCVLPTAMRTLERRAAAGTLAACAYSAAERDWWRAEAALSSCLRGHELSDALNADVLAHLAGYRCFLKAAKMALQAMALLPEEHWSPATAPQWVAFSEFVRAALHMMSQPQLRRLLPAGASLPEEAELASSMRLLVTDPDFNERASRWSGPLLATWARLEHARVTAEAAPSCEHGGCAEAESGLRRCEMMAGCAAREANQAQFKSCAACRAVVYCCREHQVADWDSHRAACKATRKAQAEEAAGSASCA